MLWIGILTAVCAGILMSVQGVCNTTVTDTAGLWTTAAFVSLTALPVCLLLRIFSGEQGGFSLLQSVHPRYLLLGGIIGAVITGTVVISIGKLGTARAELIIVVSQLIAAYCIALTGWFGSAQEAFSWRKLFALTAALGGVIWYCL